MNFDERFFENPAAYSRYLTFSGMRVNESGARPSIYITMLKLRNTMKEMSEADMKEILGEETIKNSIARDYHCKRLIGKLEKLSDLQLLEGLTILLDYGRIESVQYIERCKEIEE